MERATKSLQWGFVATLVFVAFPTWSLAAAGEGRELLCTSDSPNDSILTPFTIKASRREFCVGSACWPLISSADRLEYLCPPVGANGYCAAAFPIVSSAGPFIDNERLTINLSTGRFEGLASGTVGDRSRTSYTSQLAGICIVIDPPRSNPR